MMTLSSCCSSPAFNPLTSLFFLHCLVWKGSPGKVEGVCGGGNLMELVFGIIRYDGCAIEAMHARII